MADPAAPSFRAPLTALLVAILIGSVGVVATAPPAAAYPTTNVELTGHGYGHGRGMGQYGALGYAVDKGWGYGQILDHFYGGTAMGTQANDVITVRLTAQDGLDLVVTSAASFKVGGWVGVGGGSAARLQRQADGQWFLSTATSCTGPWQPAAVVDPIIASDLASPGDDVSSMLGICGPQDVRHYRGTLRAQVTSEGTKRTTNIVAMEDYLRGVVPRESPASWADLGGGKGMEALKAQAVAARSYAWGEGGTGQRFPEAKTCDTTLCQVYGGAGINGTRTEDPRTDQAIAATATQVRRGANGALARTEFSSSTGGWTAGGNFPAVEDLGDSRSPYNTWTASVPVASIQTAYPGIGTLQSVVITKRNNLGADGGRVTEMVLKGSAGDQTLTGEQFRSKFQLRSNWFSVTSGGTPAPPPAPSGPSLPAIFLRNALSSGAADLVASYGEPNDQAIVCDWNGDGRSTIGIKRGNTYYLRNATGSGVAEVVFAYGDATDQPFCGDWDGNGTETIGIRRGGLVYLRNTLSTGNADVTLAFGDAGDRPLAGDWDGDGRDGIGVQRGASFFLRNATSTGPADAAFVYGNAGDTAVVGDWNGDRIDTVGVRRGDMQYLSAANGGGAAITFQYGNPGDGVLAGDWNADRVDSIGLARGYSAA